MRKPTRGHRNPIEAIERRLLLSTTIYVDANASSATHDGTSWPTAFTDLQQALAIASAGDEIHVADGVYRPTSSFDRDISFQLKDGVSLLGGYAGSGAAEPSKRNVIVYSSVLSGDIGILGNTDDNSYHVVIGSGTGATAVLNGFTITAGKADDSWSLHTGGGMYNSSASPTVVDCTFSENLATSGGGMYNSGSSSPTLINCNFSDNWASYGFGGGMYNYRASSPLLVNCTFSGNRAAFSGGGMYNTSSSSPMLRNCTFSGNFATYVAGGMDNEQFSSPTLSDCSFDANSAGRDGGGIYNYSSSSPTLINCALTGNRAGYNGGGMYSMFSSPTLTNCTFSGNSAGEDGGGMANGASSSRLINCTFSGNSANHSGGGIANSSSSPTLSTCVFSSNTASSRAGGGMYNFSSSPTLSNCTFSNNSASAYSGGGMYNNADSSPTLSNCIFSGNSARSGSGGGMYNSSSSSPALTNCTFSGNSACFGHGGGMYNFSSSSPKLTNCTFAGNSVTAGSGGGMYNWSYSSPKLINCTFSGNSSLGSGGGMYNASSSPTLRNCIIWGNLAPSSSQIYQSGGTINVSYSDIQDGWAGVGNIDADPLFIHTPSAGPDGVWGTADDDYGDLRLRIDSPCIDAGDNSAVPAGITTDIAGNPRFVDIPGAHDPGAIVDMGAYERVAPIADASYVFDAGKPTVFVKFGFDALASSIAASDLLLTNLTTGQTLDCGLISTVRYDALTRTATWVFNAALPDGNYRAILPAKSISDTTGTPALGANLTIDFFALGGDANRDRKVDITDLSILTKNWQGRGKVFSQGDFNYDGKVDAKDLGILSTHWQQALPPPPAPVRAPVRTPTRVATGVL